MFRQITLCIIILFLGAVFAAPSNDANENAINLDDDDSRIINGTRAAAGEHPYMCSLQTHNEYGYSNICGGTLIHSKWILTAAHCIVRYAKDDNVTALRAMCGSTHVLHYLFEPNNTTAQVIPVDRLYMHQKYKNVALGYDVALMELTKPFIINQWVRPIALAPLKYDPIGHTGINIGWGAIHPTNKANSSMDLMVGPGRVLDPKRCREDHGWKVSDHQICIFHNESASCSGDSGGPHIHKLPNGQIVQVGIVSYGAARNCSEYPGVFTKVSSFLTWIRDVFHGNYHKYDLPSEE